ncbi:MAG: polysaccharide deacetylase family protein [Bacteroidaceae bacterium]|nr:polysaccharide deacetylase family protein [Bacteroidaceae bacterium]MDO4993619.1 polysaccharide deacetylase family protein [Bacteroidales bacterium]
MFIEQPSTWLRWLYPSAIWRMNPNERSVYLTFDDGPIPEATPWILDTLDRYGVKGTFFMVGDNVRKHPELYDEVVRRGHRVGNHTHNHIKLISQPGRYLSNVLEADKYIHSNLFRPPHGWMWNSQYIRLRHRFTIIMWDLVTRDYSTRLTADDVLDNVKRYARPGSIITFHDSLKSIDKLHTVLPCAIEWLKEQGYDFRIFDENQSWSRHLK